MIETLIALLVLLVVFVVAFPILLGVGLIVAAVLLFAGVTVMFAFATALISAFFWPLVAVAVLWAIGCWLFARRREARDGTASAA